MSIPTLVDAIVLLAIGLVLPLALGGRRWWWAVATVAAAASLQLPAGWSAVLVAPFAAAVVGATSGEARRLGPPRTWPLAGAARVMAGGWALVAAGALAQSRAGATLLGIHEPIVEVTAVHYSYAGAAALVLAATRLEARPRWPARGAVVVTAAAPPLVALGFVTGEALPQVGGAALMAVGVCTTAACELAAVAAGRARGLRRGLLAVSGLAIWVPMVLAIAWAAGQHWHVPALSIPDMARTHGLANALAFVLCGLLAARTTVGVER